MASARAIANPTTPAPITATSVWKAGEMLAAEAAFDANITECSAN
jgi:hypothetical protein